MFDDVRIFIQFIQRAERRAVCLCRLVLNAGIYPDLYSARNEVLQYGHMFEWDMVPSQIQQADRRMSV